MKSIIVIFFSLCIFGYVNGQNVEERGIGDFNKISVQDKLLVSLINENNNILKINCEELNPGEIVSNITNKNLEIKFAPRVVDKGKNYVTVDYSDIEEITGAGRSEISTDGMIKRDSLTVDLKSGAIAYLGVDVKYLKVDVREGAMLYVEGYADEQDITVNTSGTYSGFKCEGEKVFVDVKMKGKAKIYSDNEITGKSSSWGYVCYKGNPQKINVDTKMNGTFSNCED